MSMLLLTAHSPRWPDAQGSSSSASGLDRAFMSMTAASSSASATAASLRCPAEPCLLYELPFAEYEAPLPLLLYGFSSRSVPCTTLLELLPFRLRSSLAQPSPKLTPLLPGPAPFCLVLTLSVRAACKSQEVLRGQFSSASCVAWTTNKLYGAHTG